MSLLKIKNLNSIIYVSLKELRMNNMQRKNAIQMFAILSNVVFTSISVRVSIGVSYLNNMFLWRHDGKFWYYLFIIARENVFHPCKIGRAVYGVRGWSLTTSSGQRTDLQIAEIVRCQFLCDHSIVCVPIFTMQTSVVVAQWLKGRPVCLLFMIVFIALIFI